MQEFIHLSRAVAADLAAEFRDDPEGELAAWLQVALEREGTIARLYRRRTVERRFASLPAPLARCAITKLNGIGAREAQHVTVIRALAAAQSAWPHVALKESWGRLQGIVLSHLAGANAFARVVALIMLNLGARSSSECAAARTVAGLDARGFLALSRTLEITAVESYQRILALLAALSDRDGSLHNVTVRCKLLGILRDERVHRDVFHILHVALDPEGGTARAGDAETELPESVATRPIAGPADLNALCRAILALHYGAAIPRGAPRDDARRAAVDFWRWQMENPLRTSYLVEYQRQDLLRPDGDVLLLGTAGLEDVARERRAPCSHVVDDTLISRLVVDEALSASAGGHSGWANAELPWIAPRPPVRTVAICRHCC
jgi:hypothetical protein